MITKMFGKYGAIASMAGIFIVGGLMAIGIVDPATGAIIMGMLGVQGAASDSAVKKQG